MTVVLAVVAAVAVASLIGVVVAASRRSAAQQETIDRLRRERAARTSETQEAIESIQRLQTALDTIPQGVCLADERGEVVFRNQAARDFEASGHSYALVAAEVHRAFPRLLGR